jgi:hypothetical protein
MAQTIPTPDGKADVKTASEATLTTTGLPSAATAAAKTVLPTTPAYPADWAAGMAHIDDATNQQVIALVGRSTNANVLKVITTLYQYIDAMNPKKPMKATVGAAQQVNLFRSLSILFNHTAPDFRPAMTAALALFHAGRQTVFSDMHAFRFISNISNLTNDRMTGYTHWMDMMIRLADFKSRALVLKQYRFGAVYRHPDMTEQGKQRIHQYFT